MYIEVHNRLKIQNFQAFIIWYIRFLKSKSSNYELSLEKTCLNVLIIINELFDYYFGKAIYNADEITIYFV